MKTYHTYFGDSQQAETKLKRAQSQRVKSDQGSYTVIGRRFRRDYDKLSEKVPICSFFCSFHLGLSAVVVNVVNFVFQLFCWQWLKLAGTHQNWVLGLYSVAQIISGFPMSVISGQNAVPSIAAETQFCSLDSQMPCWCHFHLARISDFLLLKCDNFLLIPYFL